METAGWFYGIRMIAHYVDLSVPIRVHVLSIKAWEAWAHGKHVGHFYDLIQLVTWDQRQRVKALSITKAQLKVMPTTAGLTLRARYKDANKAAMEVAISRRPLEQEKELREQNRKYNRVAPFAVQRIKYLLDTRTTSSMSRRPQAKKSVRRPGMRRKPCALKSVSRAKKEDTNGNAKDVGFSACSASAGFTSA